MPAMGRRLFTLLSVLSLLLAVAATAAWVRSHRDGTTAPLGRGDSVSWAGGGVRYTLRSDQGRLTLLVPPLPPTGSATQPVREGQDPRRVGRGRRVAGTTHPAAGGSIQHLLGRLRNEQVAWREETQPARRIGAAGPIRAYCVVKAGTPAGEIQESVAFQYRRAAVNLTRAEAVPPLLEALEDPRRFVVAHVLLTGTRRSRGTTEAPQPDGSFVQTRNGLRVHLRPKDLGTSPHRGEALVAQTSDRRSQPDTDIPAGVEPAQLPELRRYRPRPQTAVEYTARVDPAQIPAIRDYWYDVYGMPVAGVRYGWVVAGLLLLPALWFVAPVRGRLRRRAMRRRGLCRRCGYDLTGNRSGVCPECGTAVRVAESGEIEPPEAKPAEAPPQPAAPPAATPTGAASPPGHGRRWRRTAGAAVIVTALITCVSLRERLTGRRIADAVTATPASASPAEGAAPAGPVATGAPGEWVRLGDVEVRATSAGVGPVPWSDLEYVETSDPRLWVKIDVRNLGERPLEYLSWNDAFAPLPPRGLATAVDEQGARYRTAWDFFYPPLGGITRAPLHVFDPAAAAAQEAMRAAVEELDAAEADYERQNRLLRRETPGETRKQRSERLRKWTALAERPRRARDALRRITDEQARQPGLARVIVTDVLVLEPAPAADVTHIDLELPGRNVGQPGRFRLRVLLPPVSRQSTVADSRSGSAVRGLPGQPVRSTPVQRFLTGLPERLTKQDRAGGGEGCEYHSKAAGVILHVDGPPLHDALQTVDAVTLFAGTVDGYRQYAGELPYGLSFADRRADVEQKLGTPDLTYGGTWVKYGTLGLSVMYGGRPDAAADPSALIGSVTLHAPEE